MLDIILDKDFLTAFPVGSDNIYCLDFIKFLKKIRKYRLITNFSSVNEMKMSACLPLIEYLIDGKPPEIIKFCEIDKYINDEVINGIDKTYPFKLFLVEMDYSQQRIDYGFEFINSSNLPERWKIYYSEREDKKRKVTNSEIDEIVKFDSWSKLKEYDHPFNSLIIFDLYLLGDKDGQKINDNLFPLLENLLEGKNLKSELHITIITEYFKDKIELIHNRISEFVSKINGVKKFNLNIIKHDKRFYPRNFQDLKFRRIYTNYLVIEEEKGFNCFKKKNETGLIHNIGFSYITDPFTNCTLKTEIDLIKRYVEKVQNRPVSQYLSEEINFFNNKNNRLLN